MSRRVGLRLVPARAVDEVQEGLAGDEAPQILEDLDQVTLDDQITACEVEEASGREAPRPNS